MVDSLSAALDSSQGNPFLDDENRLLERLIQGKLIGVSYHPVVDLRTRTVFAYEALCRPKDGYFRTPEELLESAVRCGRMGELGRHLRDIATSKCAGWPLFLNLHPHEFAAEYLVRPDDPIFRHSRPVYLEISETVPVEFSEACVSVLAEIREKGILLSIDDFGAGSSSLKYIVELRPDIVKLDRELVMNCLPGSREFELLHSLTDLCHRMKAVVIAEGIETPDELKAVIAAGVDYGQGFLLAMPQDPPPPLLWPPEVPFDRDEYLREFSPSESRRHRTAISREAARSANHQADREVRTGETGALERARRDVRDLQTELEEARRDREVLARELKRLSHTTSVSPPKHEQPRAAPAVMVSGPASGPTAPNQVDALEFLQQLESPRPGNSGTKPR